MATPTEVELLRARDMALYGNADSPTFAFLVEQGRRAGLTELAIYEVIMKELIEQTLASIVSLAYRTWRMGLCRQKRKIILKRKITWKSGADPLYPYRAEYEGGQCLVRINDFPDDHLYTLIVNDREVAHFDDWPLCWTRP